MLGGALSEGGKQVPQVKRQVRLVQENQTGGSGHGSVTRALRLRRSVAAKEQPGPEHREGRWKNGGSGRVSGRPLPRPPTRFAQLIGDPCCLPSILRTQIQELVDGISNISVVVAPHGVGCRERLLGVHPRVCQHAMHGNQAVRGILIPAQIAQDRQFFRGIGDTAVEELLALFRGKPLGHDAFHQSPLLVARVSCEPDHPVNGRIPDVTPWISG